MSRIPKAVALVSLLTLSAGAGQAPSGPLTLTGRLHHLRSGPVREWAEFAEKAEGAELRLTFAAWASERERTLRLRHRDLKQPWRILVNGTEIGQLPPDEADTITSWAVPGGTLKEGTNELRIGAAGRLSDDVLLGEASLIDRPLAELLSEASVDLAVVEEPGGAHVPARITVADTRGARVSTGNASGPDLAVRPGVIYTRGGRVRLMLPAGRYVIHAGRGFEYGVAALQVDLAPGANPARRLAIRREVETRGWVAMDTHLHTGEVARHGDATVAERLLTIAGEGIELPISTEHNVLVDLADRAAAAGVADRFTPVIGTEVTTSSLGHFNVFPVPRAAGRIDEKASGWPQLEDRFRRAAGDPVVVLNHARDDHGGFRPFGRARHVSPAGEDLSGWRLPANAMEIVNSGAILSDPLALPRDWMGLLNRGILLTPVGSSDSHDVTRYIAGQGRTYVRLDDREPGKLDVAQAMAAVRAGRVMVSYGLLTEIEVGGKGPGEIVSASEGLAVRIRVQGPSWTRAERVALYVNGEKVREEPIAGGGKPGVKFEGTWRLPRPAHDVHLVAIATGPGIPAPYWPTAKPYQPDGIDFTPSVLGVSGAVFVDADGTGQFESAFAYARREFDAAGGDRDRLARRLGAYDAAVAIQAASLVRAGDPAGFESAIRSLMSAAPRHVARGLAAYVRAWKESATSTPSPWPSPRSDRRWTGPSRPSPAGTN